MKSIEILRRPGQYNKLREIGKTLQEIQSKIFREQGIPYQIVGDAEADIERNTISFTTPIARSLIKKELGEFVEVDTPGGIKEYEITEIKLI